LRAGIKIKQMETYTTYKGYGITYYSVIGLTTVSDSYKGIKHFPSLGEQKGLEEAKKFIDNLVD
jgi:hypothetical protein